MAALVVVFALSLLARGWHLDRPPDYMFDEVYYAKDASTILHGNVGPKAATLRWEPGKEVSWAHPEAGKLAIALGILVVGDRPLGWRLPSVIAGMLVLACVYPIARRLGLSPLWALVALVFAACDMLGIAQSRIATLDVFVALWTVLCIYLALRYAEERHARWLLLTGLAGGLAVATKWSGLLALVAAVLVIFVKRRRRTAAPAALEGDGAYEVDDAQEEDGDVFDLVAPSRAPAVWRIVRQVLLGVVCLVLVPVIVYLLGYTQYFASGHTWSDFAELHRQMWHFNTTLSAPHSYASNAPTWIIDKRPVWYYFDDRKGVYAGVVAMGNPFLWWTAVAALIGVPLACAWRRTRQGLLPLALVLVLYLPWFATHRTSFLYYMTPVAPFMAVLVAQWFALLLTPPEQSGGIEEPIESTTPGRVPWLPFSAWVTGFLLAAFAWYPLGRGGEILFGDLPRHPGPFLVTVVLALVAGLVLLAVVLLARRVVGGLAGWLAWAWAGGVAGIGVAFLPIVLATPIAADHFYRLMWFTSWI